LIACGLTADFRSCGYVDLQKPCAKAAVECYIIITMQIALGADHVGFALKEHLKQTLLTLGHQIDDLGTNSEAPTDYPPICAAVARAVASGRVARGIVLGGSGQGEQMTANKVRGIRAALCNDLYTARMSRLHNDANVLSMGGRIVGFGLAEEIVKTWLETPFEGGRHQRRLDQIAEIEHS
jgi:ribose 5-phosphate isomerase B